MAERTNTVAFLGLIFLFVQTAVVVNRLAVQLKGLTRVTQLILVRPNRVRRSTTCFAITGVKDNDPVYVTVIVEVVVAEVDALIMG